MGVLTLEKSIINTPFNNSQFHNIFFEQKKIVQFLLAFGQKKTSKNTLEEKNNSYANDIFPPTKRSARL